MSLNNNFMAKELTSSYIIESINIMLLDLHNLKANETKMENNRNALASWRLITLVETFPWWPR